MRASKIITALCVLLLAVLQAQAAAWSRAILRRQDDPGTTRLQDIHAKPPAHRKALDISIALTATPSHPPDPAHVDVHAAAAWFSAVAERIALRDVSCSADALATWAARCEEIATSEKEQRQLAVLLTVCQHRQSSRLDVPAECAAWLDGSGQMDNCLDAFSRSAQYWTSYTNFLSRISETCAALNTQYTMSTFKSLFQAMAIDQQTFIKEILDFEVARKVEQQQADATDEERQTAREQFFNEVQRSFASFVRGFQAQSQSVDTILKAHQDKMTRHQQQLHDILHNLTSSASLIPSFLKAALASEVNSVGEALRELLLTMKRDYEQAFIAQAIRHENSLALLVEKHQVALVDSSMHMHNSIQHVLNQLDTASAQLAAHNQQLDVALHQSSNLVAGLTDAEKITAAIVAATVMQKEEQERMFQEHVLATGSLINATRSAQQSILSGNWGSVNLLAIGAAVLPHVRHGLLFGNIRLVSTSIALTLLAVTWHEYTFNLLNWVRSGFFIFYTWWYPAPLLPLTVPANAFLSPWRTESGKEFLKAV